MFVCITDPTVSEDVFTETHTDPPTRRLPPKCGLATLARSCLRARQQAGCDVQTFITLI